MVKFKMKIQSMAAPQRGFESYFMVLRSDLRSDLKSTMDLNNIPN